MTQAKTNAPATEPQGIKPTFFRGLFATLFAWIKGTP